MNGCNKYINEKLARPPSSNFISHLNGKTLCKGLPKCMTYAVWSQGELGESQDPSAPTMPQIKTGARTGTVAQRQMMRGFTQYGFENPVQSVTKKGWHEQFFKVIICDDLAFRVGEGQSMKDLLVYLLPSGYTIPSHHTVCHDLDILYEQLDNKLNGMIKVCQSSCTATHSPQRLQTGSQFKACNCKQSLD
jgi:hypothetical protein